MVESNGIFTQIVEVNYHKQHDANMARNLLEGHKLKQNDDNSEEYDWYSCVFLPWEGTLKVKCGKIQNCDDD